MDKAKQTILKLIIAMSIIPAFVMLCLTGCSSGDKESGLTPTPPPTDETPFLGAWCSDDQKDEILFLCFYTDKVICISTNEELLKENKYDDKIEATYYYDSTKSRIIISLSDDDTPLVVSIKGNWIECNGRVFSRVKDNDVPSTENNGDSTNYPTNNIVSTGEIIQNFGYKVKVSGTVKSTPQKDKVWFRFGVSPTLSESRKSATLTLSNSTYFEIELKGILDHETYYYQAYAERNGVEYKGEIKKFKSEEFFYSQQNKTYEMITLKGGPYGDINIMQTELDPNHDFIVGNEVIKLTVTNNGITKGAFREFMLDLVDETGYLWRMPTSEEWILAAKGGVNGDNYKYSGSDNIDEVAWYSNNSSGSAHVLAAKKPNKLGLYDMSGNRAEVINDLQAPKLENDLVRHPTDGVTSFKQYPTATIDGFGSVAYGGNWSDSASDCTIYSYQKTGAENTNRLSSNKFTFRLVYSRKP